MGMPFLTLWTLLGYLASATLVGAALAALEMRTGWRPRAWPGVTILFLVFACIDSYWFPVAYALDLTCTMDVTALAVPSDVGPIAVPDLFHPDGWDAVAWIGQVVFASHIASWLERMPGSTSATAP